MKINNRNKNSFNKKMRLTFWGYTNGEYLYMLQDRSLMLKYKTYTTTSLDDALEARKELVLKRGLAFGW